VAGESGQMGRVEADSGYGKAALLDGQRCLWRAEAAGGGGGRLRAATSPQGSHKAGFTAC